MERKFNDVRDVVDCYLRLLEKDFCSPSGLNVCSGRSYKLRDTISLCAEIAGRKLEIEVNRKFVRQGETKKLAENPTNLTLAFEEEALPTPVRDTLAWMFEKRI